MTGRDQCPTQARHRAGALLMLTWDHIGGMFAPLHSAAVLRQNLELGDSIVPVHSNWILAARSKRPVDHVSIELLCQRLALQEPLPLPVQPVCSTSDGHDGQLSVTCVTASPRPEDRRRPSRKLGPRGERLCAAAGSINLKSSFGKGKFGGTSVTTVALPKQADANEDIIYHAALTRLETCLR